VKEQKKQEVAEQMDEMERQVSSTIDLFDTIMQLWKKVEEDQ
jgi:hypothetical protein